MGGKGFTRYATAGFLALLTLAACETEAPPLPATPPQARPEAPPPEPPPGPAERSPESLALSLYYQQIEADLLVQGLLRTDGGGPDTQFTDTMLARNFIQIALFNEYVDGEQGLRAEATETELRRWERPVRVSVEFGDTIPDAQRDKDSADVASFVNRMSRVTGHPVSMNDTNANFHVLILNEDDRQDYLPRLRQLIPDIDDSFARTFQNPPREFYCLVFSFSDDATPRYARAVALIRGENPDLLRLSCIHEELAQGMGLPNDSPQARPSIFNDDEEFGLLTTHDELLLKMLYDDRLRPGMTAAEAEPIARQIAAELMADGPA